MESRRLKLDPRTKMLAIMVVSLIMIWSGDTGIMKYVRYLLALLPVVLCLTAKMWRLAFMYGILLLAAWISSCVLLPHTSGLIAFAAVFLSGMVLRMLPGIVVGSYMMKTTTINEVITAMESMRMPNAITIPMAIVFRFIPTIQEEYHSIHMAMSLRGIGSARNPLAMLEYRMVPLLMSVLNIGGELTVAAITRGMGSEVKRSSMTILRFNIGDVILCVGLMAAAAVYAAQSIMF